MSARSRRASSPTSCSGSPSSSSPNPEVTVKGGFISIVSWVIPAGSLMTCQPLKYRPPVRLVGRQPERAPATPFVTQAAIDARPRRAAAHPSDRLMPVKRHAHDLQARHDPQQPDAQHRDRSGDLQRLHRTARRITVKPAKTLPLTQLYLLPVKYDASSSLLRHA